MAPLLALVLLACEDRATGPVDRSIRLVQPLTVSWNGRDSGSPYRQGSTARFSASTQLRVVWRFRIEGSPSGAVYWNEIGPQDFFLATWDGHANTYGSPDFAMGDSCIATVRYDLLPESDMAGAQVGFVIH